MSSKSMPAEASGGHTTGWNDGGRLSYSSPHDTTASTEWQVEPLHIALLRQQAEVAEQSGDREAFWQARRAFLLEQARFYFGIEG